MYLLLGSLYMKWVHGNQSWPCLQRHLIFILSTKDFPFPFLPLTSWKENVWIFHTLLPYSHLSCTYIYLGGRKKIFLIHKKILWAANKTDSLTSLNHFTCLWICRGLRAAVVEEPEEVGRTSGKWHIDSISSDQVTDKAGQTTVTKMQPHCHGTFILKVEKITNKHTNSNKIILKLKMLWKKQTRAES